MSCFDSIPLEDIENCPNEELQAGLSPEVYFLPKHLVDTFTGPTTGADYASAVTVSTDIVPKANEGFVKLDLQIDLNSVTDALVGNRGNKKDQTTLNIFIPGTKASVLGFKKLYKNVPGLYLVKDYNGNTFLVGTPLAPAYIDNLDVTTGQGTDDNNGGTGTMIANTSLLVYTGNITLKS